MQAIDSVGKRQRKVTESPSSSLAERIGRSKAVGCSGGHRPAARADREAAGRAGPGRAGLAGTEPEATPGQSRLRPRDRRLLVAEQQCEEGDGRSRGLGRAGVREGGARPHQGRLLARPHSDTVRTGARRRRPLISPQHPAMAAETLHSLVATESEDVRKSTAILSVFQDTKKDEHYANQCYFKYNIDKNHCIKIKMLIMI
ncbi:uncharacterized protein [Taeniopygia guttata]|uniref:uncharacterized protein n=1 Tax=Taeniopygia guttata TaxID=59729 RepID=UPI003BB97FCF